MPIKVIDAKGVGLDTSVAAGIVWAVDHGARVLNLSLGGAGTTQVLDDAVAYAVRRGALVVAAAGNEGSTVPFHPAASPGAVSIAATTAVDQRYRWSNFGSWVRLAAPGCNLAPVRGGRYAGFCGTSSATPLVSGLAALAFAVNPRATGAAVEDALERAAVPVAGVAQYGRVDAPATLSLAAASTTQARLTAVFRGTVGARPKRYVRAVGPGQVSVSLTFKGARSLSLALVTEDRVQPLLNVRRRSPIRVKRTLPGGTIALVVTGAAKHPARFALTVSYVPRPAAEFRSMRLAG